MDERVIADAAIAGDMAFQRAELLGERDLLVLGEVLAAKCKDVVTDKSVVDHLPRRRIERPAQIEPDHLGARDIRKRPNLKGLRGGLAFHDYSHHGSLHLLPGASRVHLSDFETLKNRPRPSPGSE